MKKPKKKVSRKLLVRKLDAAFSKYIRWRAADADGNVQCVTCKRVDEIKSMQNGHFMSRKHYSLDKEYGEGTAMRLLERSTVIRKYTDAELIQLEKHYNNKVDEYINKHS